MNKKIDEALDMTPMDELEAKEEQDGITVYGEEKSLPAPTEEKSERERDLDYVRTNMIDLIEKGNSALYDLGELATQNQMPRSYEVFSTLMKNLMDANKDLAELSQKKNPEPKEEVTKTENHLHLTTSDFLSMLNAAKENKDTNDN